MIDIDELNVRALREVAKEIMQAMNKQHEDFGLGKWINRGDIGATGMAACLIYSKLDGLDEALGFIQHADKVLTGRTEKKETRLHG